jgi:hypothetical protein
MHGPGRPAPRVDRHAAEECRRPYALPMPPDDQDYVALGALLSDPEVWTEPDAERARLIRRQQASAAASFDQRDTVRVAAMWRVVQQLDDALAAWEAVR